MYTHNIQLTQTAKEAKRHTHSAVIFRQNKQLNSIYSRVQIHTYTQFTLHVYIPTIRHNATADVAAVLALEGLTISAWDLPHPPSSITSASQQYVGLRVPAQPLDKWIRALVTLLNWDARQSHVQSCTFCIYSALHRLPSITVQTSLKSLK